MTEPGSPHGRALILAGGGMRVAWQSGVLARLEEEGLTFAHGDGTSGGILTLGMLLSGLSPREMCERWRTLDVGDFVSLLPLREYLRSPSDLVAFGDADGLVDRVYPHLGIDLEAIRTTDVMTGTFNVCNFDDKTCEAFANTDVELDLLVAGMSLPLFMPAVERGGVTYSDAVWIKDANLLEAVARGGTELWLVWCIGNTPRYGDGPLEQYVHMIEMSANGGLFAEFDVLRDINARRAAGEAVHGTTEPIRVHVVKPAHPLPYDPDFLLGRISADTLVAMGYRDASRYLATATAAGVALDHHATKMREPARGVRYREELVGAAAIDGSVAQPLALDVSVEIADLDGFAAGEAADLCGRVTFEEWGPVYVRDGQARLISSTDRTELRYEMTVHGDGRTWELVAVKEFHDDPGPDVWSDVTTAAVAVHEPAPPSGGRLGPLVGSGSVRLTAAALRRTVGSIQPLGARSLVDRPRIVAELGGLVFRGLAARYAAGRAPRFRTVGWLPLPWVSAMALPPVGIVIRAGRDSERLRRHELAHWEQYLERGVLGYYLGYLVAWARCGFSYRRHPWEIEARRAAGGPDDR